MCNDSSIDFNEYKQVFEKVGEATETALIVLAEKLNPWGFDKRGLSRRDAALVVNQNVKKMWSKEHTLEFSRDRKSMSSYCIPKTATKLGNEPKMFCKVGDFYHSNHANKSQLNNLPFILGCPRRCARSLLSHSRW